MEKKIAVLGLGPSVVEFMAQPKAYQETIGVNDNWRFWHTDYLVCLDRKEKFNDVRRKVIDESRPRHFYTHLDEWQDRADYRPITLQFGYPQHECVLEGEALPKSLCSPFVACAIAYKLLGANELHMFGVDLVDHPHLRDVSVKHIVKHFVNLQRALILKGARIVVHGKGMLLVLNSIRQ